MSATADPADAGTGTAGAYSYTTTVPENSESSKLAYTETITNTRILDNETAFTISKSWDKAEGAVDTDASAEVTLYYGAAADSTDIYGTYTLNSQNLWKCSVTDLPAKDAAGNPIIYHVAETAVNGVNYSYNDPAGAHIAYYSASNVSESNATASTRKAVITNVQHVSLYVTKEWGDTTDYGITSKVERIKFTLERASKIMSGGYGTWSAVGGNDGTYIMSVNGNGTAQTAEAFKDLPVSDGNGNYYKYRATESAYSVNASGESWINAVASGTDTGKGTVGAYSYEITKEPAWNNNTHRYEETISNTVQKISISGSKTWYDQENALGKRPAGLALSVWNVTDSSNSVNVSSLYTAVWTNADTSHSEWSYVIAGLPRYEADGSVSKYEIRETLPELYEKTSPQSDGAAGTADAATGNITDADFINTLMLDLTVNKTFVDASTTSNNVKTVTVVLENAASTDNYATWHVVKDESGNPVTKDISISETAGTYSGNCKFTGLKAQTDSTMYRYRAAEYSYKTDTGATFIAQKQSDVYPESGNIGAYAYVISSDPAVASGTASFSETITNTRVNSALTIHKIWDTADGADNTSLVSHITLYYGTDAVSEESANVCGEYTLDSTNGWTLYFNTLPKKDSSGNPLIYHIKETAVTDKEGSISTAGFNGHITDTKGQEFESVSNAVYKAYKDSDTLQNAPTADTNYLTVTNRQYTDLKVVKHWADSYGGYSITSCVKKLSFKLEKREKAAGTAAFGEWTACSPEQTNIITADSTTDDQSAVLFKGLPVSDGNGKYYQYRAVETGYSINGTDWITAEPSVNGGILGVGGTTDTSKGTVGAYSYDITSQSIWNAADKCLDETVTNSFIDAGVRITKKWDDYGNSYSTRPGSLNLKIYYIDAAGVKKDITSVVDAGNMGTWQHLSGDTWEYDITGLPKYYADGTTLCSYDIEETAVPSGYSLTGIVKDSGTEFTITNKLVDIPKPNVVTPSTPSTPSEPETPVTPKTPKKPKVPVNPLNPNWNPPVPLDPAKPYDDTYKPVDPSHYPGIVYNSTGDVIREAAEGFDNKGELVFDKEYKGALYDANGKMVRGARRGYNVDGTRAATGDTSALGLWLILMLSSGGAVIWLRRRRRHKS